jgi:hypothetical protein
MCEYETSYRLTKPGTYRLAIELLYDTYYALDEVTNHWPPLRKRPILALRPEPFSWYHKSQITPESNEEVTCVGGDEDSGAAAHTACSPYEANDGRWVRQASGQPLFTRVRVKKIRRQPILFQWESQAEDYYKWVPYGCKLEDKVGDIPTVNKCLAKKKIIIGGDSQLRALYFSLLNVLRGQGVECVQNVTATDTESPKCIPNVKGGQHYTIADDIKLDFADDHYFSKLGKYSDYDVVIVGYAQHPASKEHWPLDRYRNELPSKSHFLYDLTRKGKKVIWYGAPQYPHSTSGYPIVVMDWRTDLRLKVMNEYAYRVMESYGIPIVDSYAISTAMGHSSPDQAHFHNWVIYEIVNVLLNAMCP